MAADVVERPHLPIRVANQEHRLAGHGDRHHVARLSQLVRQAGKDPRFRKDPLVLELEDCLARVGRCRQPVRHRPWSLERCQRLISQDRLQRQAHGDLR